MQQIAAAWAMTQLTRSPALVALLATAAAVPTFLLALPAGALADVVDRRLLILVTQVLQMVVAAALGVLSLLSLMTPAILLCGTALYGLGNTFGLPPMSAILPELVGRDELDGAIALNAMSFTGSQALGPALGGALVAVAGAGPAFLVNAVSFTAVVAVFMVWGGQGRTSALPAEHLMSAMRTGARYVRNAPEFQIVLARIAVHMICYVSVPSLLVLAVREHLHSGAGGYGVALGAIGIGGVFSAAFVLPRLRHRVDVDRLTLAGAVIIGCAVMFGLVASQSLAPALPGLFIGGGAAMVVLSCLQAAAQKALPDWIRGRGLAVVQLTFQAAMAIGAIIWGALASSRGIDVALLAAGATLIALSGLAYLLRARVGRVDLLDLRPVSAWAAAIPTLTGGLAADDGPVMALIEYVITPDDEPAFTQSILEVGRARRRDGAMRWSVVRDSDDPTRHIETYLVNSWLEHQRERGRITRRDQAALRSVATLHQGDGDPPARYLVGHHGRTRHVLHRRLDNDNGAPPE